MKKQFLPALLLAIAFTHLSAQTTITLTFTAEVNGSHQPLDSILIQNLTQGRDTTLVGADTVLVLEHGIGINDGVVQSGNQMILYPAYPNPAASTSTVRLWLPKDAPVVLRLYNLSGRELATFSQSLGAGAHSFTLTTGRETGYLLVAEAGHQRQVQRIVSMKQGEESYKLSYAGYHQSEPAGMRKGKSAFPWVPGDALRFAGFTPTSIETEVDNPLLSSSYTFQFSQASYPPGTVHCDPSNPTEIVDVINPVTGRVWMDRNLGAARAATSSTDSLAHGDLYQWGRFADGHQCRTSTTTAALSSSDDPGHSHFISAPSHPHDWRVPQNDNLWQGVNGVNNPCPASYRLPTESELTAERMSWNSSSLYPAFNSRLKLPDAGSRSEWNGSINAVGSSGRLWSSTVNALYSVSLSYDGNLVYVGTNTRSAGLSVRCIKQ